MGNDSPSSNRDTTGLGVARPSGMTSRSESAQEHPAATRDLAMTSRGGTVRLCLTAVNDALDWLGDHVVLFRRGDLVFVSFGLFAAVGAFVSLAWTGVILVGQGLAPKLFFALVLSGSAAILVGSWLVGQLLDYHLLLQNPGKALRRPVFVFWGGFLATLIVLGLFAQLSGFSMLLLFDALARAVPLGHALGRLGCLSYGCCYGRPSSGPLAITYRNPHAKAVRVAGLRGVPLHPAAFYEALLDVGILVVVNITVLGGAPVGVPTALGLLVYGTGRFVIEFLRNNEGRMVAAFLSVNHLISLSLVAIGAVALPALLLAGEPTPTLSWKAVFADPPWLIPSIAPGALLLFLGFSVHRGHVGVW